MGLRMRTRRARWLVPLLLVTGLLVSAPVGTAQGAPEATQASLKPKFSSAVAFDVSPAMSDVAKQATTAARRATGNLDRPERGPASAGRGFSGDAAVQSSTGRSPASIDIPSPTVNFEGIPAEALERVFDPFWRMDSSRSEDGSGLGLALAKRIVESLGGRIDVQSEPDRGSRFAVLVPGSR